MDSDHHASFGQWVRTRRQSLRLTQAELAQRTGCSTVLIRKIEADTRRPSSQVAELLAPHLALSADQSRLFVRVARAEASITMLPLADRPDRIPSDMRPPHVVLPAPGNELIGREHELVLLGGLILHGASRTVTLLGPPGVGKTRLALGVAWDLHRRISGGTFFVPLASINDVDGMIAAVAHTVGVREQERDSRFQALRRALSTRHLLLVLDNVEHLPDAAPCIAELVSAAPQLIVLTTSRAALRIASEHVVAVQPLESPSASRVAELTRAASQTQPETTAEARADLLAGLGRIAAVRLLVARARAGRATFQLTWQNAPAIATICRRLDGLPLAIELAAAQLRVLDPQVLLGQLQLDLPRLTDGLRDRDARQRTLEGAIAWSYHRLTRDEQRLFRRLGVFVGSWTLEAAAAVDAGHTPGPVSEAGAPDVAITAPRLMSLVDQSLVSRLEYDDGTVQFALLETVRVFAQAQLELLGELAPVQAAHLRAYRRRAETAHAQIFGPQQVAMLDLLQSDVDNLYAALAWAIESGELEDAARLAASLPVFWMRRDRLREGERWLMRVLARRDALTMPTLVAVLYAWSMLQIELSDLTGARTTLRECQSLYDALGDHHARARVLTDLGHIGVWLGDSRAAVEAHFQEAIAIYQGLGEPGDAAQVLSGLGWLASTHHEYERARALHEQALALRRNLEKGHQAIAASLANLSQVAQAAGDYRAAFDYQAERLDVQRALGERRGVAVTLRQLALCAHQLREVHQAGDLLDKAVALSRGDGDVRELVMGLCAAAYVMLESGHLLRATALAAEAVRAAHSAGDVLDRCRALRPQGLVALAIGDLAAACGIFAEQLTLARASDDRRALGRAHQGLGMALRRSGRTEEARAELATSLAISEELGLARWTVLTCCELARVAIAQDDVSGAAAMVRRAIAQLAPLSDWLLTATTCEAAGLVLDGADRTDAAAVLLAAARAVRSERAFPIWPVDMVDVERALARAAAKHSAPTSDVTLRERAALDAGAALELAIAALEPTGHG